MSTFILPTGVNCPGEKQPVEEIKPDKKVKSELTNIRRRVFDPAKVQRICTGCGKAKFLTEFYRANSRVPDDDKPLIVADWRYECRLCGLERAREDYMVRKIKKYASKI